MEVPHVHFSESGNLDLNGFDSVCIQHLENISAYKVEYTGDGSLTHEVEFFGGQTATLIFKNKKLINASIGPRRLCRIKDNEPNRLYIL